MEIQLIKAKREAEKTKILLDEAYGEYGEQLDEQVPRKRPQTRGLKRALKLEEQKEAELANHLTLNEQFSKMMNENQEYWLERVNSHLEKLLVKVKRDNEIHKKMSKHYAYRERISRAKLKAKKDKIESLTKKEEKRRLDILAKASLHASNT